MVLRRWCRAASTAALPGVDGERRGESGEKEDDGAKAKAALCWTFMDDDQRRRFITRNAKSSVRAAAVNQATGRRRGRVEPDTFAPARAHWPDQNVRLSGQNAPSRNER